MLKKKKKNKKWWGKKKSGLGTIREKGRKRYRPSRKGHQRRREEGTLRRGSKLGKVKRELPSLGPKKKNRPKFFNSQARVKRVEL